MEKDIHYFGTYAMALAAGIPKHDAAVIAYAAQFTDDSTRYDSETHRDGGLIYGIATAHHPPQVLLRLFLRPKFDEEEQRRIWIPFHFLPGGIGDTFHERILCVKDSPIANEMLENHLVFAEKKAYRLELIGICAHVYADTFSHYGFSGLRSEFNRVVQNSITLMEDLPRSLTEAILARARNFFVNHADMLGLGHGSVATMPDRPYLKWTFEFERRRPGNGVRSIRNNQEASLEACENLHDFFSRFARQQYAEANPRPFADIRDTVHDVLCFPGREHEREEKWKKSGLVEGIPNYDPTDWENGKKEFEKRGASQDGIGLNIYRFYQAATYHRYYVLKDLLPSHGIAVY
jgi:hypothetical protein